MDFKVRYLDAGLASSYFSDQETALQSQRLGRKYKNQLRDFLTNVRTKRKSGSGGGTAGTGGGGATPEYLQPSETPPSWTPTAAAAAAAAAAAYSSPSVGVYPSAATAATPYAADNGFYASMHHHQHQNLQTALPNLQNLQTFYPALDNRFTIPTADNLFAHGYRGLAGVGSCAATAYYAAAEYSPYVHAAAAASTNGFLPASYDSGMGQSHSFPSIPHQ